MPANRPFDRNAPGRSARLLVVVGGDRQSEATAGGRARVGGVSDVHGLIADTIATEQLNLSKQLSASRHLPRGRGAPGLARYDCVLNLVTDPDQNPRTLELLAKLLRGYRGRVVNQPEAVLRSTRDQVARRLAGIDGLVVPNVLRLRNPRPGAAASAAARSDLSFPLIVRFAGTHTGRIVGLAGNPDALESACAAPGTYILTEFVDYRDADGLFRKYRLWAFGDRAVFRHLAIADEWNVHVKMANTFMFDRPELIAEEVRLMARPEGAFADSVHRIFGAMRERLGLDYFGLDFGFDREGRMILFEANATMSYFPLVVDPRFSFRQKLLEPAQAAVMAMLGLQD